MPQIFLRTESDAVCVGPRGVGMLEESKKQFFGICRSDQIVGIEKKKYIRRGDVKTGVPGCRWSSVFLMNNSNAVILFGKALQKLDVLRPGAAVVYNDPLKPRKGLVHNTVERLFKIFSGVIERRNDADKRRAVMG